MKYAIVSKVEENVVEDVRKVMPHEDRFWKNLLKPQNLRNTSIETIETENPYQKLKLNTNKTT